ncbi:hypothetical protein SLA2020_134680 [Shorea laevis]
MAVLSFRMSTWSRHGNLPRVVRFTIQASTDRVHIYLMWFLDLVCNGLGSNITASVMGVSEMFEFKRMRSQRPKTMSNLTRE